MGKNVMNNLKCVIQNRIFILFFSFYSKEVYWLWRLREVFDGQSIRGERLPLENMIEGLITQEPQTCDAFFSTEITDHLFQKN